MRTDRESIYQRELEKALAMGMPQDQAEDYAKDQAEAIYWDLVDQGRQKAKDR